MPNTTKNTRSAGRPKKSESKKPTTKKTTTTKKAKTTWSKKTSPIKKSTKSTTTKSKKTTTKKATTNKKKTPIKTKKQVANKITKPTTNKKLKKKKSKKPLYLRYKLPKRKEEKKSNFAFRLLGFSILLLVFALYKSFRSAENSNIKANQITETLITNYKETTENIPKTVTIESYEKIMWKEQITTKETWENIIEENIPQNITEGLNKEVIDQFTLEPYTFLKAYERDEVDQSISILQKLLYKQWYYTWEFNDTYNQQTRNAIYLFQKKYKILWSDTNPWLRGYFGPNTRYNINKLMPKN